MAIQGIDVSRFQGKPDWQRVNQAGKIFAFAKASQGVSYADPMFASNWTAMSNAGMMRGAYHFYSAASPAIAQANNFIRVVGSLDSGDLPPVLDLEDRAGMVQNHVTAAALRQGRSRLAGCSRRSLQHDSDHLHRPLFLEAVHERRVRGIPALDRQLQRSRADHPFRLGGLYLLAVLTNRQNGRHCWERGFECFQRLSRRP